jgi:hypothetical protein
MPEAMRGLLRSLLRFVFVGPERTVGQPTLIDTILPWPVRLLVVLVAGILGWCWDGSPLGEQLSGGLHYAGLIAISLAASYWWFIFLFNFTLALAWLLWPIRATEESLWMGVLYHGLSFVNRQIGHIEVLSVWTTLAIVGPATLARQLAAVAAVLLLGEPLLSGFATGLHKRRQPSGSVTEDMYWLRRPLFYLATFAGIVATALLAPRQWFKLVPGAIALAVADAVRYLRHVRWTRRFRRGLELSERQQALHRQWARRADMLVAPGIVLGVLALLVLANVWARHRYDAALKKNGLSKGGPVDYCTVYDPPAPAPDVSMFIISDSQFHELRGRRFVGQMEFADALVPVALRPVELDVLSVAPLYRFATVYRTLADQQPTGTRLWWAHLGDLADLSCRGELDRANRFLRASFDANALAGIAPGNHDKAFTGNFFWSPYWDSACPSGRLEKNASDEALQTTWQASIAGARGRMLAVPGWDFTSAATRRGGALITATPLGRVREGTRHRGVIAIFLDTSDGRDFDLGVAGLFGTFSDQQAETVNLAVRAVRDSAGSDYDDPLYLVFMHHPLGEMAPRSELRLKEYIASLDGHDGDPHVVGIISAHTHEAQEHSHCIGGREIPEIVVGSTIDPPQEAALLSVGPVGDDAVGLRVQTLPAVARPGKTCKSKAPSLTARACQEVMADLRGHKACEQLFRLADAASLGRDCSDIEHPLEINDRLQLASSWTGPGDEDEIRADQRRRVRALFACVCRDGLCSPGMDALDLDDESYFALVTQQLPRSPERERELACLAWAGAAVQRYKTSGMSLADALRCAFDDDELPGPHDYIARLEVTPCY